MKKLTREDISQDVFDLYDDYAHSKINRKKFLEKLSLFAIGGLTVPSLLSFIMPNYVDYTAYFYSEVNHGFHNNTTPRFDEPSASLAWSRTISFFKDKLK